MICKARPIIRSVLKAFAFIVVFALLITASLACAAGEDALPAVNNKTLKVAFYPLDGFFEYDEAGNENGYGVELLSKISQYTGIRFEYVRSESWEATKQMVVDGITDLRMPASKPVTPSETLSYNSESIIDTYHVMLALKTRADLFYLDYNTIKTLKVAISSSFYKGTAVKEYLSGLGVSENRLVFCSEYNECLRKLESGEVDALVSNIMDMNDDMKMLARFNSISNYFTMKINNPMLAELDDALRQIKLDEPLFLPELYAKWFPERTVTPFTIEESRYLASLDSLTFAFRENEGYLSRNENGEYLGIYVEQAKEVCEKLGVQFRAVSLDDCLAGKAKADVYCGFYYDRNYAEERGYAVAAPIGNTNYYFIQKKETRIDEDACTVAAIDKFYYTKEYLKAKFGEDRLIYFDTYEECLQAVARGQADATVINNYIAEYYLEMYQFSNLSARLIGEYSHLYCFAASDGKPLLTSVLSKAVSSIHNEDLNKLYIRGTERKPESDYLLAFIYKEPIWFSITVGGIFALAIAISLMLAFIKESKKQNKALEKALSAKSEFLARMSHDMRTPLNAVLGFSRLARNEINNEASVKDSLDKIESSGEYLLGLINDVLDASKLESGKTELRSETVNSPEFLRGIAEEMKAQGKLLGVTLACDLEKASTEYVKLDKLRNHQILANLIGNALKFSKKGGVVEWYSEDEPVDDTHIMFTTTITDHGCGMSEEFMKHMFEPFTQESSKYGETREGTGLGLTIVKKFVELAGGTIEVKSKAGEGTTFTVRMKRELPSKEEIEKYIESKKVLAGDTLSLDGKRILLCEDHPLNREITVRMLAKAGAAAECAENGSIGAQMFERSARGYYDAILMDVRMPVMDGLEAAKAIRASNHESAADIPIIAVTANAYSDDVENILKAGMNAHIPKPIQPRELYKALGDLISAKGSKS